MPSIGMALADHNSAPFRVGSLTRRWPWRSLPGPKKGGMQVIGRTGVLFAIAMTASVSAGAQVYLRETDTLFQSAYCVGVLSSTRANLSNDVMQSATKMFCSPGIRPKEFASLSEEDC